MQCGGWDLRRKRQLYSCGAVCKNAMRISFGNVTPQKIEIGMERLGSLIKTKLR